MQSSRLDQAKIHVAIIMDGNGRWATRRCLPRTAGHRAGAAALRRIVEAAPGIGVSILTVYAFSSDNWQRPASEVDTLMKLFHDYVRREERRLVENDVRLSIIGRRDRLSPGLVRDIERIESKTAAGCRLHLRVAIDYSSRYAILEAAKTGWFGPAGAKESWEGPLDASPGTPLAPDVDLLIRTGGEKRLSDFLLWESAYAELWFSDTMWPEFAAGDLSNALADFRNRDRRFGRVSNAA